MITKKIMSMMKLIMMMTMKAPKMMVMVDSIRLVE